MRKLFLFMLLGLITAFMATGCTKTKTVEPGVTEKGGMAGSETVTEEARQRGQMLREDISGKYIEDVTTSAKFEDIHFDFDKYNVREDAKSTLRDLASWLGQKDAKVIVEGHCDERGTDEYNLGLGDRRANSTKQYLVASGVSPNKVETISYGEEKPLCMDKSEGCWSKNRRAHFVVLLPK